MAPPRRLASARPRVVPVEVATAERKNGAGAHRSARQRDPDRQRRHQGAGRYRDHRRSISATAPRSRRATCCSRSMAARSKRRSAQIEGMIAARQAQLEQAPSATSSATPIWSPRTRPRSSLSTTPRPRSTSIARDRRIRTARMLENLKVQLELLHHPRADLRPHQHGQREGRQFRAAGRYRADGDHQPDGAGLCQLHGAAEESCRKSARRWRRKPPPSRRSSPASRSAPPAR